MRLIAPLLATAAMIFAATAASASVDIALSGLILSGANTGSSDVSAATPGVGVINGATIDFGIIPEPRMALLMGLGLSGLAMAGRRRSA